MPEQDIVLTNMKSSSGDLTMLKLAREISMDIRSIEDILKSHEVPAGEWELISKNEQFQKYLSQFIVEWNSAINTGERIKLKSMSMLEEALPEFFARLHDQNENLPAKTEVLKTIARIAGIGGGGVDGSIAGERLSVTINLGADRQVRIEKDVTPYISGEDRL